MAQVTIRATPNGPYLVEGDIDLYDTAGSKVSTEDRPKDRVSAAPGDQEVLFNAQISTPAIDDDNFENGTTATGC